MVSKKVYKVSRKQLKTSKRFILYIHDRFMTISQQYNVKVD